jgi:hypothetical protein
MYAIRARRRHAWNAFGKAPRIGVPSPRIARAHHA